MSHKRYLRVTIHDNDFTSSLEQTCETLYNIFQFEECFPEEEDFDTVSGLIKAIWHGVYMAEHWARWSTLNNLDATYLMPKLEFVAYDNLPDWDNGESVYIPMFYNGCVLTR